MAEEYTVKISKKANKKLEKLAKKDAATASSIYGWLEDNIEGCLDPRAYGEPYKGNLKGFWKYRIGDWRVISHIQDEELVVLAVDAGHRKDVYRRQQR